MSYVCNRAFNQRSNLKTSQKWSTKTGAITFVAIAVRLFQQGNILNNIKMVHKGHRDHNCNYCNRAFSVARDVHEGKRNCVSNHCNRTFSQKGDLLKHIWCIHKDPKPKSMSRPEKMINDILEALEVDFQPLQLPLHLSMLTFFKLCK